MHVSPPIAVLAILAVMLAAVTWLAPPQREADQIAVVLSAATYQKLALWGKAHAGADGQPQTVVEVIEALGARLGE